MSRVVERTVYAYTELTGRALDRARSQLTDIALDGAWWEYPYDNCVQALRWLGFEVSTKDLRFSGFWSQGDGPSFTGNWSADRLKLVELREDHPNDVELHALAVRAQTFALEYPLAEATITRSDSRYVHEHTMQADVYLQGDDGEHDSEDLVEVQEWTRDCARWVYSRLEAEHDYRTSEYALAELASANEYEFDEDGQLA